MADADAQPTLQPTAAEDDLLAKLDALELVGQQSAPIPLVRSTSDHRQPIPSTSDTSPSPETESWSSPSTFPLTPTSALSSSQQPPVISPPPPSRRTLVLFQEACAKHRYTRDGNVSTIVERPERIRAVKTGVAAAWARLEARNIAHGGVKWSGAPGPAPKDEDAGLEALMKGMGLAETGNGKGKAREVLGGPFDILLSTAVLPVDDPALHFIHPLPNLPPTPPLASRQAPPPAPAAPSPLPSSSRTLRTPSASPAKPPAASLPSSSAAPLLDSAHRLTPSNPFPPWPQQLSTLCKDASQAILSPPFSEIPPHLPQGDLYLTEGSEEAIFGALGAVCEGVDRIVEGTRTGGIGYDRAFVAIRPPGHHCCEATPMGFCFVNNVAVAAAHAHLRHGVERVVILDIDLHHGNGTQDIVWRINQEANRLITALGTSPRKGSPKKKEPAPSNPLQIFYGSLHDIFSYPCEEGDPANVQAASLNLAGGHSQWISNVHLESFDQEAEFHERLYPKYRDGLLGAAGNFCRKTLIGEADEAADKTLVIVSAGFDASQFESAGMSRHRRNVPTSFFHRFSREICRFANEHSAGKVLAVLEGGYADRALSSGALATMVALTESPRILEKTFLLEDGNESAWWEEASLAKLERATKPRRGKLGAAPPSSSSTSAVKDESWLPRALEVFSLIEGHQVVSEATKEKREPVKSMTLRERRPRGVAGVGEGDEWTPQASPAKGLSSDFRPLGQGTEAQTEQSALGKPSAAPKIKFTFKQAGI